MGAPVLLGGGAFHIGEAQLNAVLGELDHPPGAGVASFAILTEIATGLRNRGYKVAAPKRGTPEDVRASCDLAGGQIELLLLNETETRGTPQFRLLAVGFNRVGRHASQRDLATEWKGMSEAIDGELSKRLGARPVDWLTGSELAAKMAGTGYL